MKTPICVVFDVDDTLYLERDYVRSGFAAVGEWAAKWLGIEAFGDRCWNHFAMGLRGSIFDQALRESDREASPELVAALVSIYRTHRPDISLASDAADALDAVSGRAHIAVVTDGPAVSQSRKVEALGLNAFSSTIVLSDVFGRAFCKPHPRAFEFVKQTLPAAMYLYVADNPRKDFTAPRQLGWMTVRVRRPEGLHFAVENPQVIADHEMKDCSGLSELLKQL